MTNEYMTGYMAIKALERQQNKKNCNNCKYGYLSSVCKEPSAEICGNNFSKWKPVEPQESEDT